ncbi:MAG: hydroxymethylglutaryl-CoA lyase [Elusimicrobia bacterium]|nr:hydroxymethylglutaryl-CoA lyase [Elusimicrobiota bacterium]
MRPRGSGPIRVVEVGPRDGLQNERAIVALDAKTRFVEALADAGLREVEAGAFVHPDRVPQMADSGALFARLKRRAGVTYSALVPNETGLERALEAKADKIAVFTAASETFNRKNINASIARSLERFAPVVRRAREARLPVRGYVSTAFWCPFEGRIPPKAAVDVCLRLLDLGVAELSVGDTIGRACPDDVRSLLEYLVERIPLDKIFLHLHDTYGMAVANALCAWTEFGVTGFDASAGGLGGCPYAPGASGNVATEDLLFAFHASGAEVPADAFAVAGAARALEPALGRPLASRLCRVGAPR